jgi:hypothetical protein
MKQVVAALLFLVIACGDDPPVETPPTGIPLGDLAAELAEADCARLDACNKLPAPLDREGCVERQANLLYGPLAQAIEAASEAGTLSYFELAAKDCRARVSELSCEIGVAHDLLAEPACAAMLTARGAAGAACTIAQVCPAGMFCGGTSCPGTCTAYKTNNEACDFGQPCGEGLYCDLLGRRCLAVAAANQACALSIGGNSCATGTFCDQANPAAPVCHPVRGRGQGCGDDTECIAGARCVLARCSAGLAGDGCETRADCSSGLHCTNRVCAAPIALDAACTTAGTPCVEGAGCDAAMKCVALPTTGQPCAELGCWLSRCTAGTCVAASLDGEACTTAQDCLPDRSCQALACVSSIDCH